MSDILSQEEVDALLSAVSSSKQPKKKCKLTKADYEEGFKKIAKVLGTPEKGSEELLRRSILTKYQLWQLQDICEEIADNIVGVFEKITKGKVEVDFVSIVELFFEEVIRSLPSCMFAQIFRAKTNDFGFVEINPYLVRNIYKPKGIDINSEIPVSKKEGEQYEKLCRILIVELNKALKPLGVSPYTYGETIRNSRNIRCPSDAASLLLTFEVRLPHVSHLLSYCFTYNLLKEIQSKLPWRSHREEALSVTKEGCSKCMRVLNIIKDLGYDIKNKPC